ncbi:MAG: hypothetical protein KDI75_06325 [Xanthomonadales bacterium]|nr:hypothetical protein [Xanthomonadales bacterium]
MSDAGDQATRPLFQAALDAFRRGDDARALRHCQALLATSPADRDALALRTNLAVRADDLDAAIAALSTLMQAHGEQPAWRRQLSRLFNRRGARRRKAAAGDNARADLRQALQLDRNNTDAWFNLALCERDAGNDKAAAEAVTELLRRQPADEDGRILGAQLLQTRSPAACLQQIRLLQRPALASEVLTIAAALDIAGDENARAAYAEVLRLAEGKRPAPLLRAELGQALALPAVVEDAEQLKAARQRFLEGLGELEERWDRDYLSRCEPSLEQLVWCNFKLAYQGENDNALQSRYGDLLRRPLLQWFPQWRDAPRPAGSGRQRVGLLSSCWRDCTAGHYFGGWVEWLASAGYDVYLYQLGPVRDGHTDALAAMASHFRFHDGDLASLATRIREDRLHLLIYPEIGMDARLLPLANLRLAHRQAAAWGHPSTTGLPEIDAFVSCAAMEPADAASHYRERLLTLPGIGVNYVAARPLAGHPATLPDEPRILLPHSLFKLHPDNDALIADIAARIPDAAFLLFRERYPAWNQRLAARLRKAFSEVGMNADKRLHWLSPMSRPDYLSVNREADLMLDALHWSGGNTSLDAFAAGLPVLTARGALMRGRQTAAMLEMMDLGECVAPADKLAEAAERLLNDREQLSSIRERVARGRQRLFGSNRARDALLAHVERLVGNN